MAIVTKKCNRCGGSGWSVYAKQIACMCNDNYFHYLHYLNERRYNKKKCESQPQPKEGGKGE